MESIYATLPEKPALLAATIACALILPLLIRRIVKLFSRSNDTGVLNSETGGRKIGLQAPLPPPGSHYKPFFESCGTWGAKIWGLSPTDLTPEDQEAIFHAINAAVGPETKVGLSLTEGCIVLRTSFYQRGQGESSGHTTEDEAGSEGTTPTARSNSASTLALEAVLSNLPAHLQKKVTAAAGAVAAHDSSALPPGVPRILSLSRTSLPTGTEPFEVSLTIAYSESLEDLKAQWSPLLSLHISYNRLELHDTKWAQTEPHTFTLTVTASSCIYPQLLHVSLERKSRSDAAAREAAAPHVVLSNVVTCPLLPPDIVSELSGSRPDDRAILGDITALLDLVETPARRSVPESEMYLGAVRSIAAFAASSHRPFLAAWASHFLVSCVQRSCGRFGDFTQKAETAAATLFRLRSLGRVPTLFYITYKHTMVSLGLSDPRPAWLEDLIARSWWRWLLVAPVQLWVLSIYVRRSDLPAHLAALPARLHLILLPWTVALLVCLLSRGLYYRMGIMYVVLQRIWGSLLTDAGLEVLKEKVSQGAPISHLLSAAISLSLSIVTLSALTAVPTRPAVFVAFFESCLAVYRIGASRGALLASLVSWLAVALPLRNELISRRNAKQRRRISLVGTAGNQGTRLQRLTASGTAGADVQAAAAAAARRLHAQRSPGSAEGAPRTEEGRASQPQAEVVAGGDRAPQEGPVTRRRMGNSNTVAAKESE